MFHSLKDRVTRILPSGYFHEQFFHQFLMTNFHFLKLLCPIHVSLISVTKWSGAFLASTFDNSDEERSWQAVEVFIVFSLILLAKTPWDLNNYQLFFLILPHIFIEMTLLGTMMNKITTIKLNFVLETPLFSSTRRAIQGRSTCWRWAGGQTPWGPSTPPSSPAQPRSPTLSARLSPSSPRTDSTA